MTRHRATASVSTPVRRPRASSARPPRARRSRRSRSTRPARLGRAWRPERRDRRRGTTKQRTHSQHVPSRSPPVPVCAASACTLPARVARHAADTTRSVLVAQEASNRHRRMIEQHAQRAHQAPGREDDARRRREELVSTVHDGADGRGPRYGVPRDVLMISVDLAAVERSTDREHHKAIDEVDDDPRRGTLGLLAAHGGLVPRACRAGRPEAPDTPTARGCTWRKVRVLHHPKFGVCVWGICLGLVGLPFGPGALGKHKSRSYQS